MAATPLNVKVDSDLKRQAEAIFAEIGLTTSAGVNIYLKKVVAVRGIPFDLRAEPDDEEDAMATTRLISRRALNDAR
ncbi:MAG: type II toxin-antitoxin system RelB/DinJ family antitoxin [Bifidobacteriaceae bacterium]|nr:type II toxin-antitoxin system RelB/DinJ family antitoxin [Bifidobacteriaceae bacterium]